MELREYLDRGVSPFHVVKTVTDRLREEGFEEIKYGDQKELKVGQGYFVSPFPTMAFAFFVNPKGSGLHIGLAHTDSPSFLLKPNPEMPEEPYLRVNVEP
ncbi:MAG: M18 family aminopeptidase, partial [Lachnospiraceae bacterium]|nr:M18 family aminopeptidase [Lachnospiraceae bacterium]